MEIINFKKANCKNCFKCLRECPVKAIAFRDGQAGILNDNCLICGHCLTVCPQNAKQLHSEMEQVRRLLKENRRVIASVAPSFIASFPFKNIAAFEKALQALGFAAARETAVGAAAVAARYERLLGAHASPVLISSSCPTVVRLMEKYYPETLGCLAGVVSPMTAHALLLKKENPGAAVVFIGPCISKMDEASWEENAVDYVLTFDEMEALLKEAGLMPETAKTGRQENPEPRSARFFPVGGGILKSMPHRLEGISYVSVSGIARCREVLEELRQGSLHGYFIEMSACDDSCVGGPCMVRPAGGRIESERKVGDYARRLPPAPPADDPALEARFAGIDLARRFTPRPVVSEMPGEGTIREILAKTGKKRREDELNCGACGYSTCREKAVAVYQGKAELGMCMPYMRERAEFISDNVLAFTPNAIIVLDNFLHIQALNRAAVKMFGTADSEHFQGRYIGKLTDSSVFEEAIVRKENILDRKTYLYQNDLHVEQSVIYVREHNLIFGIFRDLTETRRQTEQLNKVRLETVDTADKVIEKQMRIAQEIAMLLGESTAETKIALTKLKETMVDREEEGQA